MKVGNWRWAIGLAVAGLYLGGCAQNVPDIDRTQPNKIEKAQFQNDDEWRYRQTVIETDQVGSSGGLGAFESWEGPVYRVRWTITEDVLYAMSTVEPAEGVYDGKLEEDGRRIGVVAAFPILGHFDVQRGYNSSTGEQSNVISENASDREWYDRKYMRVDWSTNLAGTFSSVGGILGIYSATNRDIPQDDRRVDPDRTRIGEDYIDTVTEYIYEPDVMACYTQYGYDSIFNCESGPLRVRNSFVKVPEVKTYAAFDYADNHYLQKDVEDPTRLYTQRIWDPGSGQLFEVECDDYSRNFARSESGSAPDDACEPAAFDMFKRFGYFRTQRVAWDPARGAGYEDQRLHYANRFNIWQTMFDEDGGPLDIQDRTPKPIVYYTNPEYPRDMWPAAQEVASQWNDAFLETVRIAQGKSSVDDVKETLEETYGEGNDKMFTIEWNSCSAPMLAEWATEHGSATGADRIDVPTILADFKAKWATGSEGDHLMPEGGDGELYTAVWASAHDARTQLCADLEFATQDRSEGDFTWQRIGDLRYSFFNWIDQEVPWGGYGPSAADPITGEILAANANYNGGSLRRVGPYAADLIQYLNGELEEEDLIFGEHVREYLDETMREARQQRQGLTPDGKRALASRTGTSPHNISPTNFESRPSFDELPDEILWKGVDAVRAEADRISRTNELAKATDTRMAEFAEKADVQRLLLRDPNFRLTAESMAATQFGPDFNQDDLKQAVLDVSAPNLLHARNEERNTMFMKNNIMLLENIENSLQSLVTYSGIAEAFKGKSREEIERHFMDNVFIGTQLHEVGHNVGLRHNFAASMDSLNYHDEFWEIHKAIAEGKINSEDRWNLPEDKIADIIGRDDVSYVNEAEFRVASVMDYTADLTGRFAGLGKYDKAAITLVYGEHIEQFKSDTELEDAHQVSGLHNRYSTDMWLSDYTELPRIFANVGGSGTADPDTAVKGIDVIQNGREWVPLDEAISQYREGVKTNSANLKSGEFEQGTTSPWIDRTVPYEFCSDYRRNYVLGCDAGDWGSNQREVVNHKLNTYRVFQPFRRYNRGKTYSYNQNISYYAGWLYGILKAVERPFRYYSIYQWWDLGAYTDDLREASIDAMNFYAELMATPDPGRYCRYGDNTRVDDYWWFDLENVYVPARWDRNRGECGNFVDVPKGEAQFFNFRYTDDWTPTEGTRVDRVGTYIDKLYAAVAMFQISSNFIDSTFFTDFRATNVSYWTLFNRETLGFLRGSVLGDYDEFAGVYNRQTGTYERPRLVDTKTLGTGLQSDQVGMPRIYTPVSFGHNFQLLVGAMLNATTWEDRYVDFGQYVKLAVSTGESQPFPEATEIHEFVHPTTHQIYTAAQTHDGESVAVELVQWANVLRQRFVEARQRLEAAEPGSAEYESANDVLEGTSQQLEDVVAKMDLIRFVYDALGPNALR